MNDLSWHLTGAMMALLRVFWKSATKDLGTPCRHLVFSIGAGLLLLLCASIPPGFARGTASTAPRESRMLAVQVLLDRADFSVGEIDGHNGLNTQKAVQAFQRAKG